MRPGLEALGARRWDLLVVGGGIHGLFAALDAAQRGLSVALVEAADFGSGLSFNHQRTLHGGLRALQSGALGKARRQIDERRTWARMAPHLIRPLPFLIGTYRGFRRSRTVLRTGLRTYDWIGRARNAGVPTELHIPRCRLESAAATRKLFRGIDDQGLTGGAIWYDYQTRHPDRLTWLVACAARESGAVLCNHARVMAPMRRGQAITGLRIRDEISGGEIEAEAAVTLLAAGAATGALQQMCGAGDGPPLLRAMNVLLDRPARDIALAAPGRSGRMLTAVPWAGAVLVGTSQSARFLDEDHAGPMASDVAAFVEDLAGAFPALEARSADVRLVHAGLTPAVLRRGRAELQPEPAVIRHRERGVPGLVSLVGVKYTTARWAAEHAIDVVCRDLGGRHRPCRTGRTPLPHAGIADGEGRLTEASRALGVTLERDVFEYLASWYGTEAPAVLEHAAREDALERLDADRPVIAGEISYAIERGAAVRLADAVQRRTALGGASRPSPAALEAAAAIMAERLGWDADRTAAEIAAVEARYFRPAATR